MTLEKGAESEQVGAAFNLPPDLKRVVDESFEWLEAALSQMDRINGHERCELLFCARILRLDAPVVSMALERAVREILAAPAGTRSAVLEIEDYLLLQRYGRAPEWRQEFLRYWIHEKNYRGSEAVSTISALLHCVALDGELSSDAMRADAASWFTRYELESSRMEAWAVYSLSLLGLHDRAVHRSDRLLSRRTNNGSWDGDVKRTLGCLYPLVASNASRRAALDRTINYVIGKAGSGVLQDTEHRGLLLRTLATLGLIPPAEIARLLRELVLFKRIFISYSHNDKEFVDLLAGHLEREGLRAWVDSLALRAGDDFVRNIQQAIEEARFVVVVISRRSIKSDWVQKEIELALGQQKKDESLRIIPLLVDDSPIPPELRHLLGADFRREFGEGLNQLILSLDRS